MRRVLIVIVCALLLSVCVFAQDSISEMKTDCTVQTDGSCRMTQTVTVSFDSLTEELRLPLAENAKNAEVVGYKTRKVVEDDVTILVLNSNTGITGSRTFTITYTIPRRVTAEGEIQILSVPLLCAKWEYPIEHYAFTVTMPKDFETYPTFLSGYQGDAIEDHMSLRTAGLALDGEMKEPLKDRESLEMQLELPAGYFTGARAKWSASWLGTAFAILFAVLALVYWFLKLRTPRLRVGTRNLPPDSVPPGDVPYLLCGGKTNFNMTVCHWANLGYLTISVNEKGNVTLHKRMEMGNERRKLDQKLFAALFEGEDTCGGESLRYKRTAAKAMEVTPRFWRRRLYHKHSGNAVICKGLTALSSAVAMLLTMSQLLPAMSARGLVLFLSFFVGAALSWLLQGWLEAVYLRSIPGLALAGGSLLAMFLPAQIGGGIGTMLLAIGLSLFTGWQTLHGGRRTDLGDQFIRQTLGYRKYLRKVSQKHARGMTARDPQYFYKALPYAEAMGMGAEFANRCEGLELEPSGWFVETKPAPRTSREFYTRWREALATLELSIRK